MAIGSNSSKNGTLPARKDRVWEIDALRGLLILSLLAVHLYHTVDAFCVGGIYKIEPYEYVNTTDPLHFWFDWGEDGRIFRAFLPADIFSVWNHSGVAGFFVISGISCLFSRNNLRRGIITLIAAYALSAFTGLLAFWTGDPGQFIRFGALHCYGYCQIIYYFLFEKRKTWVLLSAAAVVLAVGYYLRCNPVSVDTSLLLPFGVYENGVNARDYWPIFPMLGWLLCGAALGKRFYAERKSLLPTCFLNKWTRPLQVMGRHSGKIYIAQFILYPAVFFGIGWVFNLL